MFLEPAAVLVILVLIIIRSDAQKAMGPNALTITDCDPEVNVILAISTASHSRTSTLDSHSTGLTVLSKPRSESAAVVVSRDSATRK